MRVSGSVRLPSGIWDWRVRPQQRGSTVVFTHRHRPYDEMAAWVAVVPESEESIVELALEPVSRSWEDADGLLWQLTLEPPEPGEGAGGRGSARVRRLVMRRGSLTRVVDLPAGPQLGALSHSELCRLAESTG